MKTLAVGEIRETLEGKWWREEEVSDLTHSGASYKGQAT